MRKNACLLLCLSHFWFALFAQHAAPDTTLPKLSQKALFLSDEPLQLTLVSNFRMLKRKKERGVFQPATASLLLPDGAKRSGTIELSARGEFRRQACAMPSLMLNFGAAGAGELSGLKKLKMVCGCNTSPRFSPYLLKEYLVYKIYNLLTPLSFGVRLATVTYVDAGDENKAVTQYAFLLEDVDAVAKRNRCTEYRKPVANSLMTGRQQATLVHLFQFMIGNLDWSVPNRHNIKLLQEKSDSAALPLLVPYDFDFCGLVNAPYAFVQENFNVERVTDRLYRGFACTAEEIEAALQPFREKKEAIYSLIRNFELLPSNDRKDMLQFLDGFYNTVSNKREVQALFVNCQRRN